MLIVEDGIAGLRAGVDAVEDSWFAIEVVAVGLEVLVPVGKFDDELDLGVDGFGGADDEVARGIVHHAQAEVAPALVALGGDVGGGLGVVEEEVVENDLVEVARGELGNLLDECALGGIGVAEGDELAGLDLLRLLEAADTARVVAAAGIGDAAGDLNSAIGKEFLDGFEKGIAGDESAAVGLDVDLVHFDLAGDFLPGVFEPGGVLHLFDDADRNVDGDMKLVAGRTRRGAEPET